MTAENLEVLETLQSQLAQIYALPTGADIRQFLIDRETLLRHTEDQHLDPEVQEQILIRTNDNASMDIGLYFREGLLKKLEQFHPEQGLDQKNFADFCVLIEGVSHFLLLEYRSAQTLPIRVLELELQAEVDKFVTSFIYQYHHHGSSLCAQALHRSIFDDYCFRDHLRVEERERYLFATQSAAKLCQKIQRKFLNSAQGSRPDWAGFFRFLRSFYRQGWHGKYATILSD